MARCGMERLHRRTAIAHGIAQPLLQSRYAVRRGQPRGRASRSNTKGGTTKIVEVGGKTRPATLGEDKGGTGFIIDAEHRRGVTALTTRELRQIAIGHGNVGRTTAQNETRRPIVLLPVRSLTHLLINVFFSGIGDDTAVTSGATNHRSRRRRREPQHLRNRGRAGRPNRISTAAYEVLDVANDLSWSATGHSSSASRTEHTAKLSLHKRTAAVEVLSAAQALGTRDS
jgi:hypothetical protein